LHSFGAVNFLTFACWFFLFCVLLCVAVSLATPAPPEASVSGLTFSTLTPAQKAANRNSYNAWDIFWTLVVLATVATLMIRFSG
jgi:SSS family solute:Na+ symporter